MNQFMAGRFIRWEFGIALVGLCVLIVANGCDGDHPEEDHGHAHGASGSHEHSGHGHEEPEHAGHQHDDHDRDPHEHADESPGEHEHAGEKQGDHAHDDEASHGAHEGKDHGHEHGEAEGISFTKEQQQYVEFRAGTVGRRELQPSVPAQGIVRPAPDATARLRAPFAGRVLAPSGGMPDIGTRVDQGQTLAVIAPTVDANALPMLRADLSKARTQRDRLRREVERLKRLVENGAIPKKRLLDAQSDLQAAEAEVEAAEQRMTQYQSFERGGRGAGIPLRAPSDGRVIERTVTSGEYVEAGDVLLRTIDDQRLRLEARVAEANLPRLDRVQGVWLEPQRGEVVELNRTEESFFARIDRVDPTTRTISIWFGIPAEHDHFTAGHYHRLHLRTGKKRETLAVPATSLIEEKGIWTVYVVTGPETFRRRRVRVGIRDGEYVEITDGLAAGDRIVTRGAYYVKLAAATTGVGGHHH